MPASRWTSRRSRPALPAGGRRRASLRQAPYLKFHIDENPKKEIAVLELLQKVSEENAELDRKRAEENQPPDQGEKE